MFSVDIICNFGSQACVHPTLPNLART